MRQLCVVFEVIRALGAAAAGPSCPSVERDLPAPDYRSVRKNQSLQWFYLNSVSINSAEGVPCINPIVKVNIAIT